MVDPCRLTSPSLSLSLSLSLSPHSLSLPKHQAPKKPRHIATDVFVAAIDGLLDERMAVCAQLWTGGIQADFLYKTKPKLMKQFEHCEKEENQIPWMVILAPEEWNRGEVKIKDMNLPADHPETSGVVVAVKDLVAEMKKRLA